MRKTSKKRVALPAALIKTQQERMDSSSAFVRPLSSRHEIEGVQVMRNKKDRKTYSGLICNCSLNIVFEEEDDEEDDGSNCK